MPGGPFFNCYPGPFSNVRCNVGIYSLLQRIGDEPQAKQRAAKLRAMFDDTKDYKNHKPCTCVDVLVDELEHPDNLLSGI